MKKSLALIIGLAAFAQVQAATVSVSTTGGPVTIGNVSGEFQDVNLLNGTGLRIDLIGTTLPGKTVTYSLYDDDHATALGQSFTLNDLSAPMTGWFTGLVAGLYSLKVVLSGASAYSATASVSAVPLPGALVLFGSALLGAGALRRRKQGDTNIAVA